MLEKVTTKQFATNEDMVEGSMISEVIFIIVKGHLILSSRSFSKKTNEGRLTLLRNNSSSQKKQIRLFVFFGESTA